MFDISELLLNKNKKIMVEKDIIVEEEELKKANIKQLLDTSFKGEINKIENYYNINGVLSGVMILSDDVTLEDVSYPFTINISEDFGEIEEFSENNLNILENSIDLVSFLWQNIVLEVPSKVRNINTSNVNLQGDGWRLLTEEEYNKGNNLGLSDLKTLLDKRKE